MAVAETVSAMAAIRHKRLYIARPSVRKGPGYSQQDFQLALGIG
jgi:hypothetical protein